MASYQAVFPSVARAVSFYQRWVVDPVANAMANLEIKGRRVSWDEDGTHPQVFGDWLDQVGYFGSDQSRKATLNGVKAPMGW